MSELSPDQRQRIRDAVRRAPAAMTMQLARQLGVAEVEVIRALPDERAVELDASRWEDLLRALEPVADVHVIVSNGAVTSEVIGTFGGFSTFGEFFNVQSGSLDMHIRHARLAAVFAVVKPSHTDGVSTQSIQFFDREGAAAFKVFLSFGGTAAPPERIRHFETIRDRFRK
jgi:putative heme iron utilization protein